MKDGTAELDRAVDDVVRILWKRKWSIGAIGIACGAAALALSFLVPSRFESRVVLLPAQEDSRAGLVAQLTSSFAGLVPDAPILGAAPAAIPDIATNRRLLEALLDKPLPPHGRTTLIEEIMPKGEGLERREKAVKRVLGDLEVGVDRRTGLIAIKAESDTPETAAWLANSVDTLLQAYLLSMYTTQAGAKRQFIESRLEDTSLRLEAAENALEGFRVSNVRIGNSARLQLAEARLQRAVREQEEVYLTLKREYELARVNENRSVPTLSLVEPGYPPVKRKWPRRSLFVIAGFIAGAAIGCVRAVWGAGRVEGTRGARATT